MFLVRPFLAWLIAQLLKILLDGLSKKRFDFRRLVGAGGMPSSHAAITVALTTQIGREVGIGEPVFAVALIFTLVVIYDAAGVRQAAGRQAAVLNKILDELMVQKKITDTRLKELLGHTPIEVMVGALLGFAIGWL